MNKSFATYTPRALPLEYDAIKGRDGCEPESGNTFYGLKAFNELCVAPHDPADPVFGRPATVSYALGPFYKGIPQTPYLTMWSVWVATEGIRAGKVGYVTPPADNLGDASQLYTQDTPTHVTHAWNAKGLLAIAIQRASALIEMKRYDDTTGVNWSTYQWEGYSPALFYAALVVKNPPVPGGLVVYYLKAQNPKVLFARFEADNFATERVIMPELRVEVSRLIGATSHETKLQLFALDDTGRDVTLTTPVHPANGADSATVAVALTGGEVFAGAVDIGTLPLDKATLDIAAPSGLVFNPLITPPEPLPVDKASLSVAFTGGDVLT